MNWGRNLRLRTKVNLGVVAIVAPVALSLAIVVGTLAAQALKEETLRGGAALAESLAVRAADPFLNMDLYRLKTLVDEMPRVDKHIVYAFILDSDDQVLVHTFNNGFPVDLIPANRVRDTARVHTSLLDTGSERIDDIASPILISNDRVGTVRVGLSRSKARALVDRLVYAMASVSAVAIFLALLASALFSRQVTRRLNLLRERAEDMVTRNVACSLGRSKDQGPRQGDEVEELTETFAAMTQALDTHILELREAEGRLGRQERLLRTVLNASPDQVGMVDAKLVYVTVNRPFAERFALLPEQVAGLTNADLFPPEVAGAMDRDCRQVLETGRTVRREVASRPSPKTAEGNGGKETWHHVVCTPVRGDGEEIVGVLRSSRDITELKRVQEQLVQSQKLESLGKLAGGVAHEINTPLGIILGYAQLLMEDAPEGSQMREDLKIMEKQTKVCRTIVSDLLGFSRQAESSKVEMCFNNSIMEVVTLVRHTFYLDNAVILTDLDERMPIIYGDPEKLKQVWMNLLSNALASINSLPHTPGGGAVIVRSRLDTPAMKVHCTVSDTGSGISRDNLLKIFDPFFSTKPVGQGTGLGLSVSFGIIEDHGGLLRAESPAPEDLMAMAMASRDMPATAMPGPGAAFHVELPLDHAGNVPPREQGESDAGKKPN